MKYVLDASVGIKWVMNDVDSAQARRLRDDFRKRIHELIAPDSFPLEAAHALTKAGRRGIVTDATQLWVELMVDSPQHREPGKYRCLRLPLCRPGGARRLKAGHRRRPADQQPPADLSLHYLACIFAMNFAVRSVEVPMIRCLYHGLLQFASFTPSKRAHSLHWAFFDGSNPLAV
jgi:hypothetical protein